MSGQLFYCTPVVQRYFIKIIENVKFSKLKFTFLLDFCGVEKNLNAQEKLFNSYLNNNLIIIAKSGINAYLFRFIIQICSTINDFTINTYLYYIVKIIKKDLIKTFVY